MTLRVPNTMLDTLLKDIATLIGFLDSRNISAEDVSLMLRSYQLTQQRLATYNQRLSKGIDENDKKLSETSAAEIDLLDRQHQSDEALLASSALKDKISFSTIQLEIYQPPTVSTVTLPIIKNVDAYQPSFSTCVLDSFSFGLDLIAGIIVFLLRLWVFFLLAIILLFFYRKYKYIVKS